MAQWCKGKISLRLCVFAGILKFLCVFAGMLHINGLIFEVIFCKKVCSMKKIFFFCFVLGVIVAGCKKESPKQPTLLNTHWVLSYIQDTKSNAVTNYPATQSNKIIIDFTSSNIISFTGICNTGAGKYSFSASGTLEITDLGTTKIACPDVEWEGYTVRSLQEAYSYSINGNSLVIHSNGDYNLYFIEN